MAVATLTTESSQPPSFETVWALLKEVAESQKETSRQLEKSREETDRRFKERQEEAEREKKERLEKEEREKKESLEKQTALERHYKEKNDEFYLKLGRLTNLFGEYTIGEVAPKLNEKFREYGLVFPRSNTNVIVDDYINDIHFEIDIILENGDIAMLVEVKTKLTKDRIIKHIERLEKMRRHSNLHGDKRTFFGAVAGFTIAKEEKSMALNEGLFVIEPSGDNFNIIPPQGKPKEW